MHQGQQNNTANPDTSVQTGGEKNPNKIGMILGRNVTEASHSVSVSVCVHVKDEKAFQNSKELV